MPRRYWKALYKGTCDICGHQFVKGHLVTRATKKMGGGVVCSSHYYTPVFARKKSDNLPGD